MGKIILILSLCFSFFILDAQERELEGIIVGKDGKAIEGAKIVAKGTDVFAISDENGHYKIMVPNSVLELLFTKEGYNDTPVSIGVSDNIDITLYEVGTDDYFSMSLEELMNMEVTSVSKKSESFMETASSIYVLTEEDIKRSGATKILDVLNLVPGSWFQEANYRNSVNSFRTRADEFPQSFLVLLDGVPIWTSVTGGPVYSYSNIPLKNIKRIEIIKGPGGTIYGANANTGIINIFTKQADDFNGLYVSGDFGNTNYMNPHIAYSHRLSNKVSVSGFLDYKSTNGYDKNEDFVGDNVLVKNGSSAGSDTTIANRFTSDKTDGDKAIAGGINVVASINEKLNSSTRFFYASTESDVYTYSAIANRLFIATDKGIDYNITQKFDYNINDNHNLAFNTFFRAQYADAAGSGTIENDAEILDFEIQDNFRIAFNDFSIGGNFRNVKFKVNRDPSTSDTYYRETDKTELLYSFFIQDKLKYKDFLYLTLGIKAETWTLVSDEPEFSPSVRLHVKPAKNYSLWSAYSKSLTTPGYFHLDMERYIADISGNNSIVIALIPGDKVKPTVYKTLEFGIKGNPFELVSFDLSGFYLKYDDAIGTDDQNVTKLFSGTFDFATELVPSLTGNYMTVPVFFTNVYKGSAYGGEGVLKIKPINNLRFESSYSYYKIEREGLPMPGSATNQKYTIADLPAPKTPEHVLRFRTYLDFPDKGVYFTANALWASESYRGQKFNYVAQVVDDNFGTTVAETDNHFRLDLVLEKRFLDDKLSLRIWGKNILAEPYVEYYSEYYAAGYPQTIHRLFGGGISYTIP